MLLYGASGHGKVICSALERKEEHIFGIFDDNPDIKLLNQYPVVGSYVPSFFPDEYLIISIGDNSIRKRISETIKHRFGLCVSADALCDITVAVGDGTVVLQRAIVQRDVRIGRHCIVNTMASIDHDCGVGDYVHISPGTVLCGGVTVGEGTHIGANATIIPNISIGKWCIIGAGSVITTNIPDYSMVVGVPGKVIKKIGS